MKKLCALALIAISIFAIAVPAMAAIYGYVNVPAGEILYVRDIPEKSGNVVCKLQRGTKVEILTTYQSGWDKIKVSGYENQDTYCMSLFCIQGSSLCQVLPDLTDAFPGQAAHLSQMGSENYLFSQIFLPFSMYCQQIQTICIQDHRLTTPGSMRQEPLYPFSALS